MGGQVYYVGDIHSMASELLVADIQGCVDGFRRALHGRYRTIPSLHEYHAKSDPVPGVPLFGTVFSYVWCLMYAAQLSSATRRPL